MYGYFRTHCFNSAALAGLCFALFSVSSLAVTIDLGPSDFRTFGPNGTHYGAGVRTMRGQSLGGVINTLPRSMNLPTTVNRPSVVPYGSVAQGLKNFVRVTPASLAASGAVTALFLAVDWVFDHDSGEWRKEGVTDAGDLSDIFWQRSNRPEITAPYAEAYCVENVPPPFEELYLIRYHEYSHTTIRSNGVEASCHYDVERRWKDGRDSTYFTDSYSIRRYGGTCTSPAYYSDELGGCVLPGLIPLTESDWSDLESSLPDLPASHVSSAAGDTMRRIGNPLPGYSDETIEGPATIEGEVVTSTTSNPSTGLTTVTEQQTVTRFAYSPETITVTETTTTTNYGSDGSVESETVTETTPGDQVITPPSTGTGTAAGEWPGFCDWATVVCDWFDWTQDGWDQDEPHLPQIIDFDSSGDYQVGGAGECPAPYIINLGWMLNTTLEVSYQPFCDFAGLVKPLFLAFCYLFAGVITVRSL